MSCFDPRTIKGYSVNEKAYQIAWKVLRGELEYDEMEEVVGSYYDCIVYDGLLERIYATLDGVLSPEEERLALKDVRSLSVEEEVPVMRALFRKEFLLNPDPEKKAWHAFLNRFHKAIDPEGLTCIEMRQGRYGLSFRQSGGEGGASEMVERLNRIALEASKEWDFPLEGPRVRDIRDEADRQFLSKMSEADLLEIALERGSSCPVQRSNSCCSACLRHVASLVNQGPVHEAIANELIRLQETDWDDDETWE